MTIIIQASITTFQSDQHIAMLRELSVGRYSVTTGRWGRQERIWTSYRDVRNDATARVEAMVAEAERVAETNCDGLLFAL